MKVTWRDDDRQKTWFHPENIFAVGVIRQEEGPLAIVKLLLYN